MKRILSDDFVEDLLHGNLSALHERILKDDTLMLAVRNGYINVYYRGGSLLKLSEKSKNEYEASFDSNYAKESTFSAPILPRLIRTQEDTQEWLASFPLHKQIMDCWFTVHPKMEREFQQLVVRENNYSPISNDTEYFISDIELAEPELAARFDLLAFYWPASNRKSGDIRLALIEMKYGDGALAGSAGIVEHLKQFHQWLLNNDRREKLYNMAEEQINQLNRLGLFQHKKGGDRLFTVNRKDPLEVIFLFANHNARSKKLLAELSSPEASKVFSILSSLCDVRFFIASSAGYAMHSACMVDFDTYTNFLKNSGHNPTQPL